MNDLIEAEAQNYEANTKALGESVELLSDFEKVYEALTPCLKFPQSEPEKLAVVGAVHFLAFCRRQLTVGVLALLRSYRGDSLLHLRRAIESCAYAARICKHPELYVVWDKAYLDESARKKYRAAFKSEDVFPKPNHADYEEELGILKDRYDLCSKLMHAGVLSVAGYLQTTPERFRMIFFDLPRDHSLFSTLLIVLDAHKMMLHLFGRILEPYTKERMASWKVRLNSVEAKFAVHGQPWSAMAQKNTNASTIPTR
jgi:hypothetical protein